MSKGLEVVTDCGQLGWGEQRLGSSHLGVGREHELGPQEPWEIPGGSGRGVTCSGRSWVPAGDLRRTGSPPPTRLGSGARGLTHASFSTNHPLRLAVAVSPHSGQPLEALVPCRSAPACPCVLSLGQWRAGLPAAASTACPLGRRNVAAGCSGASSGSRPDEQEWDKLGREMPSCFWLL